MNTSKIKRLQNFVSDYSDQIIRVTKVTKVNLESRKHDLCKVCNVSPNGVIDASTRRTVKSDSIRRHYSKV